MGRITFVFLMISTLYSGVIGKANGQEATSNTIDVPSIGAAETNTTVQETADSVGKPEAVDPSKDSIVTSLKPKKTQNLMDELLSNPLNYILLLVVCVYIYLMFLQPKGGRKEQREQIEKLKNLKKNDRVVTSAGIHGIVSNINTEAGTITLRVDENSNAKLTIDRMAIRTIIN